MKLLLFSILSTTVAHSQNVFIPDSNFKKVLVENQKININADAEIQMSEATFFAGKMVVYSKNISDLTGISSFPNITELQCAGNKLTQLDVTNNTKLVALSCGNNFLTQLDISKNIHLTYLSCSFNLLETLDLRDNSLLEVITCDFNLISSLDVTGFNNLEKLSCDRNRLVSLNTSGCTRLEYLTCSLNELRHLDLSDNRMIVTFFCDNNQLEELNLKNGTDENYYYFDANYNDNLACIQVDNVSLCDSNWGSAKPFTAHFSNNCHYPSSVSEIDRSSVTVYPNPSKGLFIIESSDISLDNHSILIINSLGETIYYKEQPLMSVTQLTLDLSGQLRGLYLVKLRVADRISINKLIIE